MTALVGATPLQIQFRQDHLERRARWFARAVEDHGIDLRRRTKPIARLLSQITDQDPEPVKPEPVMIPQSTQGQVLHVIAETMQIPVQTILEDLTDQRCKDARSIYIALLIRYLGWNVIQVEQATGFIPATVREALDLNDPIWTTHAISRQAPLASVVAILVQSWAATQDGARSRYGITEIQKAVARAWDIHWRELLSERRAMEIVTPRHIAFSLAKELTLKSLPEIGRRFGGRDHTTVLHAVRKCAPIMQVVRERIPAGSPLDLYAVTAKSIVDSGEVKFAKEARGH